MPEQTWTPETVYSPDARPIVKSEWPVRLSITRVRELAHPAHTGRRDFAPEFLEALSSETSWTPDGDLRPWPKEPELVGRKGASCSICHGAGEFTRTFTGTVSRVVRVSKLPCTCELLRGFEAAWQQRNPGRFERANLTTIQPRNKWQAKTVKLMREHPTDSFFLHGDSNLGKTYTAMCLARKLLWQEYLHSQGVEVVHPPRVWMIRSTTWMNQIRAWAMRDDGDNTPMPDVLPSMVYAAVAAKQRPVLFISELDRWNPTEARMQALQELLDAFYEQRGQVIATGNLGPEALTAKWGSMEATVALRRICGEGGHEIRFGEKQ